MPGYFGLTFPKAGLLGLFCPMVFPRTVAPGEVCGIFLMSYGDGLAQDLHLFPRTFRFLSYRVMAQASTGNLGADWEKARCLEWLSLRGRDTLQMVYSMI